MNRILLALVAAAAFALTVGTTGTADARPYVRFGVGVGPGYGGYYGGGYGYGAYRPYYGNYGYRPYVGGYSTYRPYYGGYGYGGGYYRPAHYGGHHHHHGRRCWKEPVILGALETSRDKRLRAKRMLAFLLHLENLHHLRHRAEGC